MPDQVLFTSGTRSWLAMVLEVLGADGTGLVVYPRELVEELVRVAVRHRAYVLYDSVYQRL